MSSLQAKLPEPLGIVIWIALVSGSSALFSLAFACATPFAALATISAVGLRRGQALSLVMTAWLLNQAIGFGLLHYPHTPSTYAWGVAIGAAALAGTLAVCVLRSWMSHPVALWVVGLLAAFAVYEGVLIATAVVLQSGFDAFTPAIVGRIFLRNVGALAGLVILYQIALAVRLLPRPAPRFAAA